MAVEAVISSTVQLLGTVLTNKLDFLQGVEEEVGLLRDELNRMLCFLKDANNKQAQDERVRNWISEIREVAHDAKDAIEMFVNKLESKGRLGKLSYYPKHVHYINKAGKEITSIQKRLNAIHRSRELYGIRDLGAAAEAAEAAEVWRVESRRRLSPWKKKEHVVGMEEDERKLLRESVLDKEKEGLMISVVEGMGGIGKSTLAMKIYNHGDVVAGFDCRGWVVVSSEFKPQETMKQLILQLARSDEEKQKVHELERSTKDMSYHLLEKLQEMLHRQLQGKKYFIVLDDVWEKEHWECIRSAFPDEQDKTSRLLITTRNKVIAKHGQYALEMNLLDLNKSWELFLKKALIHNGDGGCPQELEQIGKTIVEKCNGLPLAISVVGGLLLETQTKSGWEEVLNRINSHSGTAENSISTILELSYQNLSPKLKSCFLCLACFKEDAAIPTKSLVHIWLSQGLIEIINEGRSRTVEEIARGYLDELINRNMVQIKDFTLDDRVKNCHLHDLLHKLCLVKAKEEMGFQIMKQKEEMIASKSSSKTRHHVVHGENIKTLSLDKSNHLRSIFVLNSHGEFGHYMATSFRFWKHFKMLGTLYLDGIGLEKFPYSFRSLISLKYLRINCGSSLKLPSWLDYLTKLEVLDTRSEEVELPYGELKMEKLRYFSALHIHGLKRMDNWKNIESLKYIKVDDFLQCSSRQTLDVRELGMFLDGSRQPDELTKVRASLEKMENLVKLKLVWYMPLDIEPMIPGRLNNLTRLKLRGGMRSCVDASVFPPNLSHLTLVESFVNEDLMAELGKLPKLLYLKLSDYAYLGCTMEVLHDGFSCLVALSLRRMYFLKRINIRDGGMPHLRHLRIHCCPALEKKCLPEHIVVSVA